MNVSVRIAHCSDDTASLVVTGEMDASNCELLESILDSIIARGARYIMINAGELNFCDVTGAYMLARVHRRLRLAGGELVVTASESVTETLDALRKLTGREPPGTAEKPGRGVEPVTRARVGGIFRSAVSGTSTCAAYGTRSAAVPPPLPRRPRCLRRPRRWLRTLSWRGPRASRRRRPRSWRACSSARRRPA
nr:hypothetical protein GCM10020093_050950 [Planobispora longispora]